jgi:hypothetical protein
MIRTHISAAVAILLSLASVPTSAQTSLRAVADRATIETAYVSSSAAEYASAVGATFTEDDLRALVKGVESILPPGWRVLEADMNRVPIGWTGPEAGLYVMVEDTQTRFFHPTGFHYFSFYRIWIMPPDWEGEMRRTPYVADSAPAFLLGLNDTHVALYHTAGGNIWEEGPREFCSILGLDAIRYSDLTRRVVDMAIEERLVGKTDRQPKSSTPGSEEPAFEMNPYRIVGLAGDGVGLYLEYVFPGEEDEGRPLDDMTEQLAGSVFERFPEVESLYLRRCTSDTFTDTIVNRD